MRIDFAYNLQTVIRRKLKFGLNIKDNKSAICANFGDARLRNLELRHKTRRVLA